MDEQSIQDAVLLAAKVDGERKTLACADALRLAEKLGVGALDIGRACNRTGVKLAGCQLGCFK